MFLLLGLVVVLAVAAGAVLLVIGVTRGDGRRPSGMLVAVAVPVVVVLVAVVLAGGLLGLRGAAPHDHDGTPATTAPRSDTATTLPPSPRVQPLPSARVQAVVDETRVVRIRAADEDRFSGYAPVGGLAPGSVVRVRAEGFGELERGRVEQCVTELAHLTACSEPSPVQFDEDGRADFQFAVRDDFAPGGCRAGQPTCTLRLTGTDSKREGTAQTVLVDELVPGRVVVEPARALADGQTVEVSVTGFPAGASATAVLCAPPEAYDARRCSSPAPTSTFVIDAAGGGATTLVVASGRLGSDAALCGPRRLCGIAVLVGPGFVAAPVTPVAFSLGPGVSYDADRLVPGIVLAVVLVGVALALARRTDWTKPTEAATPALDGADLRSGLNLDELFGTDEELDERDPIPW